MAARSVLIAEDETIIAWELRKLAQSWGLSVAGSVDSGAAAIEAFDRDGADLVLLDIFLSDSISGIEVARHIRERSSAPVIFITASQDRGTKELAMAEAPAALISKPYEERKLMAEVFKALGLES